MTRNKIMYVDDSAVARKFCSLALGKLGNFDVRTCENVSSALPQFGLDMPDLLLLDYWLDDREGLDSLREIRETYSSDQLPVVFVTGTSDETRRQEMVRAGALDVIFKPYTPAELVTRVMELLHNRQCAPNGEYAAR